MKIASEFLYWALSLFLLGNYSSCFGLDVGEYETCEHIIPKFIAQVMNKPESSCEQPGEFPKPGNCTVFFKCVQSDARIQPLIEYCATGYNFVNGVCVPSMNVTDCPQYTCRIPDLINPIGNEISDEISSAPLISTLSPPTAPAPVTDSQTSAPAEISEKPQNEEHVHSEQLMSESQSQAQPQEPGKSSGSSFAGNLFLVLAFNFSLNSQNVNVLRALLSAIQIHIS